MFGGMPWDQPTWVQFVAAAFAVIGHTYSPLLGFKGGRGIITGSGGLLVVTPPAFLASLIFGVGTVALTRYVSLGSLVGAVVAAIVMIWQAWSGGPAFFYLYGTLVPGFVIMTHKGNIQRLLSGTERKLGRDRATR
jgi:glycerol-3-phosphate acyltransferase PlsY